MSRNLLDAWKAAADHAEHACAAAEQRAAEWYGLLETANTDYRDLLDKYHALRVQGANTPAPAPAPLPRTKATPVDEVIGTVAGSNSRLRKQLKDFAIQQRFAGAEDDEIAHALLNWDEDDAGVPE